MNVILDTNILISAIFWGGKPEEVLTRGTSGEFSIYATEMIIHEYFRLIEKLSKNDEILINHWKMALLDVVNLVESTVEITECRDKKDNMFLECAIACSASFLVSGDKDLLVLNPFRDTQVLTPAEFLNDLT